MKPYGRVKNIKGHGPGKTDCHPPKGYINWWENEICPVSRGRLKQIVQKDIEEQLEDMEDEMNREVPYDENAVCDGCGKIGAFDYMGDYFCDICMHGNTSKEKAKEIADAIWDDLESGVLTEPMDVGSEGYEEFRRILLEKTKSKISKLAILEFEVKEWINGKWKSGQITDKDGCEELAKFIFDKLKKG